jgi:hypothetical protein
VAATHDGQVIELLSIKASPTQPAITVKGFKNVIVRNCLIEHNTAGPGIEFTAATGLTIQNVSVTLVGAPTAGGPLPSAAAVGVSGASTAGLNIERLRTTGGSSGVYLLSCPAAHLRFMQARNARGPFPRGQCVQFDKSPHSVLEDFSCVNDVGRNVSWTEDNISVYQSDNVTVRRGLIDGNNSPSGDGVMVESGGSTEKGCVIRTGLVEDVDAVHQVGSLTDCRAPGGVTHRLPCTRWGHSPTAVHQVHLSGLHAQPILRLGLSLRARVFDVLHDPSW